MYVWKAELSSSACGFASKAPSTQLLTSPWVRSLLSFCLTFHFLQILYISTESPKTSVIFLTFSGHSVSVSLQQELHCRNSLLCHPSRLDQLLHPTNLNMFLLKCELPRLVAYVKHVALHMLEHLMTKQPQK